MIFSFDDYGLENDDLYGTAVSSSLSTAQTKVGATDKKWENVIGSILKYGGAVVGILVTAGVIKNKNLSTITQAQYDKAQLDALLAANGGTISKDPSQIIVPAATTTTRSSMFDLSNPIVLIAIIAVVFLLFFNKK